MKPMNAKTWRCRLGPGGCPHWGTREARRLCQNCVEAAEYEGDYAAMMCAWCCRAAGGGGCSDGGPTASPLVLVGVPAPPANLPQLVAPAKPPEEDDDGCKACYGP